MIPAPGLSLGSKEGVSTSDLVMSNSSNENCENHWPVFVFKLQVDSESDSDSSRTAAT